MQALEFAAGVRLMGFDVDGVMTDGSLYFTPNGDEIKAFSSLDGHGLRMLMDAGIEVVIISGRASRALELRAANLGIPELHMGVSDKRARMQSLLEARGLVPAQAGYMGDDVVDLPLLRYCGFSATPLDGHDFVKQHVHFVGSRPAGRGAVREVCDLLLRAHNKLDDMLQHYLR
ncbi:MAG: phenylphosphate carboxylase subunit delta [Pseudazoarcus pumilus]|nr:phenylphosphate carboxylase subunit delta [Pseudazoarcus pumilus]